MHLVNHENPANPVPITHSQQELNEMYSTSIKAIISAMRSLFKNRRALLLLVTVYIALLAAIYLFVSTREATISQLILTLVVSVSAPALFFVLQAVSVSYTNGPTSTRLIRNTTLRLILVTLPVIALLLLTVYGLNKIQTHPTIVTTVRYLLMAFIAPLLAIQLWIAISNSSLRSLVKSLRRVLIGTLAPQSLFVYACGFLFFAVVPYLLLQKSISIERPWLELSVLILRLGAGALLVLLGWVTTVGAISILSRNSYCVPSRE